MIRIIGFCYFCAKALFALAMLIVWEVVCAIFFAAAFISFVVSHALWLPALAAKSLHRQLDYGVPYKRTWTNEFWLGDNRKSEDTFKKNADFLFREAATMVFERIADEYCGYRTRTVIA